MTTRERLIIKLIAYLIKFIGKGTEGFYSWEFENTIKDLDKKEEVFDGHTITPEVLDSLGEEKEKWVKEYNKNLAKMGNINV